MALLSGIHHIVVLMMENRSFDHMLGYLSLPAALGGRERSDVDGLKGTESNDLGSTTYAVNRLTNTALRGDPHHDWMSVKEQITTSGPNGAPMGGFVASYNTVAGVANIGEVMGYYTANEVPTFDFLSEHYCVCDRWFSSFPGPTIPNRLFSLAGTSRRVGGDLFSDFPLPSVFELLDRRGVSWEIYFEDIIPALGLFSSHGVEDDDHFHGLNYLLKRPGNRPLPAASWIDPYFLRHKDDDHPPADVTRGQLLVRSVYDALRGRTEWPRTLLIVTYDEHGGYYDHVTPPGFDGGPEIPDDSPDPRLPGGYNPFRRLGVRVPALLISPRIKQSVCRETLDHTSIIRTLLEQFCPDPADALRDMPQRVRDWTKPIPASLLQDAPVSVSAKTRRSSKSSRRTPARRKARKPSPTAQSELDARLKERRKQMKTKSPRAGKARVSALQRELRPVLLVLKRRGVVRSSQLPESWRGRPR